MSVVESDDPGKKSRQVMILMPQTPASALRFYQASFSKDGWLPVQGMPPTPRGKAAAPGGFLAFARGPSEMQISVTQLEKGRLSAVLANLVTKDTGTLRR